MFCTKCGKPVDDMAVICPNCGCVLKNDTPKPVESNIQIMSKTNGFFDKLTSNVGKSIKIYARVMYYVNLVLAVLTLIGGFIAFVVLLADYCDFGEAILFSILPCFGGAIGFVVSAIVNTLFIYGFGELITNSKELSKK